MGWTLGIVDIEVTAGLARHRRVHDRRGANLRELQAAPEGAKPAEAEGGRRGEAAHPHRPSSAWARLGGARERLGPTDVMFVHEPLDGADEDTRHEQAARIVNRTLTLLKQPVKPAIRARRPLEVDADLRPEGKQGAIVRSLDSPLLRTLGGNLEFRRSPAPAHRGRRGHSARVFVELIDPYRYPEISGARTGATESAA